VTICTQNFGNLIVTIHLIFMEKYNPQKIESKWQKRWEKEGLNRAQDFSKKKKFYCLDMFPYPSGAGLHVGHPEGYTATDVVSRYHRMKGDNVLHPIGWDAFGLPAENYAISQKIHPDKSTHDNIKRFKSQIKSLGFSYDWEREIDTSDPEYYRWTQWFFLFLYKNGWAYRARAPVNWCQSCQTVLANEQVINGKCDRCGGTITQKNLKQWFFKVTDFADDLTTGLDKIDWPESTKLMQKNWIGKSEGAIIKFQITNGKLQTNSLPTLPTGRQALRLRQAGKSKIPKNYFLEAFTTRPDTIYGTTYMVVAPEHKIIEGLRVKIKNYSEVLKYVKQAKEKSDLDRIDLTKEKTGVKLEGIWAINPVNKEKIPIYVADYVLISYGLGAIMAVPAHDQRDWEFAKKFHLPIRQVIQGGDIKKKAYIGDGKLINSKIIDGLNVRAAITKISSWLEQKELGGKMTNYKLRDWLISRQRYWGAPIPIVYCEQCGEVPAAERDLPIKLPEDVDFMPTGESPLQGSREFHKVECPKCGRRARRESDTMDTFVCSSWYFFRYCDPKNSKEFASKKLLKYWMPVDLYVGGAEHTVLHLMYSRFFTKALYRKGLINFDEPFLKLRHQGMVLAPDGRKMSKSLGNVVNPDDVILKYGADTMRLYEMFMGPFADSIPWSTQGVIGARRFLEKVYKLKSKIKNQKSKVQIKNQRLEKLVHQTIQKVGEDIENFKFNTAVSALMILINTLAKEKEISREYFEKFLLLLFPFAPHLTSEIW